MSEYIAASAIELERPHVRRDPVHKRQRPRRLGVGVVRRPEHRDERSAPREALRSRRQPPGPSALRSRRPSSRRRGAPGASPRQASPSRPGTAYPVSRAHQAHSPIIALERSRSVRVYERIEISSNSRASTGSPAVSAQVRLPFAVTSHRHDAALQEWVPRPVCEARALHLTSACQCSGQLAGTIQMTRADGVDFPGESAGNDPRPLDRRSPGVGSLDSAIGDDHGHPRSR